MQLFIADAILSKKKCPELQKQFIIICYYLVLIWLLKIVSLAALFDQEIPKKKPDYSVIYRLEQYLTVFYIDLIVPGFVVYYLNCTWYVWF